MAQQSKKWLKWKSVEFLATNGAVGRKLKNPALLKEEKMIKIKAVSDLCSRV